MSELTRRGFVRGVVSAAAAVRVGGVAWAEAVRGKRIRLGAAWYPEQWSEAAWAKDLDLMRAAGFDVVRVGEFAWSAMEPAEGRFEFAWLEKAVAMAAERGIDVVLGTPTDAPPAWLTQKYPETLRVDAEGKRAEHGGRRQFSYSSPLYRKFCVGIVEQMARRFGGNAHVVGWQVGNEFTDESFDAATRRLFQEFLRKKYGTLDELNRRWTTAYWSQTYDAWDEIPMKASHENPALLLEYRHFVTETWRDFQRNQIAVIDRYRRQGQFVTTNIGGLAWSDNWDHYRVCEDLSLASWDDYVGQGHLDVGRHAFVSDFVRGWKRKSYWVMETQPGFVNWAGVNNVLNRGETRAMAWQSVAHGANAILYWQWRAALNGQEQYHGCIVGPDGDPLPIYQEVKQLGAEFARVGEVVCGDVAANEVALLVSYDSRWAIDFQMHTKRYDQQRILVEWHDALRAYAGGVDVVEASADLSGYKLVLAPSLNVIDDALAARLAKYVRAGGHLVLGPRSGMKDEFDALRVERQPGRLAELLGGRVEQFYALVDAVRVQGSGLSGSADVWAEWLSTRDAGTEVWLRYGGHEGGWLDGKAAMISRKVGNGRLSYLGTLLQRDFLCKMVEKMAVDAGIACARFVAEEGVDIGCRVSRGKEAWVVVNGTGVEKSVKLEGEMFESLTGQRVKELVMEPYDAAVLVEVAS